MKALFVDTWFYIALLDGRDSHHQTVWDFAAQCTDLFVTTRWVLAETANALARTTSRSSVAAFLQQLEADPAVYIAPASDELYASGLALYAQRADKTWSLTDCISFVVMRREQLANSLTGDRHFIQAGFSAIFAD